VKRFKVEFFVATDISEVDGDYLQDHIGALIEDAYTWKTASEIFVYEVSR
jgi:hypothetical protein